jgi:hypothetical protein
MMEEVFPEPGTPAMRKPQVLWARGQVSPPVHLGDDLPRGISGPGSGVRGVELEVALLYLNASQGGLADLGAADNGLGHFVEVHLGAFGCGWNDP